MKYIFIKSTFLFFCFFGIKEIKAQKLSNDSLIYLIGYIISEDNLSAVKFAHVISKQRNVGAVADSTGYFCFPIIKSDSLLFTAMGYKSKLFLLDANDSDADTVIHIVKLQRDTLTIQETDIKGYTWRSFKNDFINMDIPPPDSVIISLPGVVQYRGKRTREPQATISSPVSLIYNLVNKKARLKRKIKRARQTTIDSYMKVEKK